MSNSATDPTATTGTAEAVATTQPTESKGKGKAPANDEAMDEDEDDEEEDDDEGDESSSDEEVDDSLEEIDPSAILGAGRRTRGVKVDYTSEAALAKAGLKNGEDDDEEDADVEMKE